MRGLLLCWRIRPAWTMSWQRLDRSRFRGVQATSKYPFFPMIFRIFWGVMDFRTAHAHGFDLRDVHLERSKMDFDFVVGWCCRFAKDCLLRHVVSDNFRF